MFDIFKDMSDSDMLIIYKDIIQSEEDGLRPRTLDVHNNKIKDLCHFDSLSQAIEMTLELFYREVAKRYFM